jgi:hypothetical protein
MPAAVRTATVTGSAGAPAESGSMGGGDVALARDALPAAVVSAADRPARDFAPAFVPARFGFAPAPAAARPGFALVRAARGDLAGFAAAFPPASAFAAAASAAFAGLPAAESRFALRFPGRELGRFPSTPPSSAMAGDSRRGGSGYREAVTAVDTVV